MSTDVRLAATIKGINESPITAADLSQKELETVLRKASEVYYNTGDRLLSDDVFDYVKAVLEERFPNSKFLHEIGAKVLGDNKAKLPFAMFSMDKVKPGDADLAKWTAKYSGPYILSDKLDGASCMVVYDKVSTGWKTRLFRRGTGEIGADISHFAQYLLPSNLLSSPPPALTDSKTVAIRGEVIMSKKNFTGFNTEFRDARGLVNGVINRKTLDRRTLLKTEFVAYEVVHPRLKKTAQMQVLSESGGKVVNHVTQNTLSEEILIKFYENRRNISEYQIDGIVVEDDGPHNLSKTGNPSFAFAFKMPLGEQQRSVQVINVTWDTSKDGRLVPRVQYDPFNINGVVLQFATGYNARFIVDNGIGPGAIVTVIRSGDVIPAIVSVQKQVEPLMPDLPYHWNDTHVDIYIDDIGDNDDVKVRRLVKFFSDMGIENISRGLVKRFYDFGFTDLAMYLQATPNTFLSLPGVQRTLAEKLVNNIQSHIKKVPVVKVMAASNIFGAGMGERKLEVVLANVPDILSGNYTKKDIIDALDGIEGFQRKSAEKVAEGIPGFIEFLKAHPQITVTGKKKPDTGGALSGKIFVFSGFRDKELQEALERMGAKVSTSVTSKTTALITKDVDVDSGKSKQARDLNIKIMTRDQLIYLLASS